MSFGAGFELFDAASIGNLDSIRTIITTNPSAARANFRLHVTPVHCAARYNQLEALRLLLVPGVAVDAANRRGWTALHCATEHGNLDAMRLLLDAGAAVDTSSTSGATPLFLAVQRGNLAAAQLLLAKGASAAALDMTCAGVLHYAKDAAIIDLLIKAGADISGTTVSGSTPLHSAVLAGNVEAIRSLVAHGARADLETRTEPVLFTAIKLGRADILDILCSSVADINQRYLSEAVTVLHYAAQDGQVAMVRYLASIGADVHACSSNGDTPLFTALKSKHGNVVKLLLQLGAAVGHCNVAGVTALHIAARIGDVDAMKHLLQHNADPNATAPPDLRSPLLVCNPAPPSCCACTALLLSCGANPNLHCAPDRFGRIPSSALHLALARSCEVCVRTLLEYGANNKQLLQEELPPYMHRVVHEFKKLRLA